MAEEASKKEEGKKEAPPPALPKVSLDAVAGVQKGFAHILPGLAMIRQVEGHFDVVVPKSKPKPSVGAAVDEKRKWNPAAWFSMSPTLMYVAYLKQLFEAQGYVKSTHNIDDETSMEIWMPKKLGTKPHKTPLLMLHGFGSDATMQWDGQLSAFSKSVDLLMPNLVFFGGSTTTSKERSMTWQGDCVLKLLDNLGIEKFDLLGFSYGSAVAYKVGLKYGHRIRRIVIADEGIMMTRQDMVDMQLEWDIDDGNGFWKLPSTPAEVRKLEHMAFKHPMPVPDVIYKDVLKVLFSTNIPEWRELIVEYTCDRPDNPYDNKPLPHPILFIWGEEDPMAPLRFAKMQKKHFGALARLIAIRDAKHMAHAEYPKEWNEVVMDFLLSEDARVHEGLSGKHVLVPAPSVA